jgi:hypothetical protein
MFSGLKAANLNQDISYFHFFFLRIEMASRDRQRFRDVIFGDAAIRLRRLIEWKTINTKYIVRSIRDDKLDQDF